VVDLEPVTPTDEREPAGRRTIRWSIRVSVYGSRVIIAMKGPESDPGHAGFPVFTEKLVTRRTETGQYPEDFC
jgi:hypothetical protein